MTCFIDACSYIYLHKASFSLGGEQITLFDALNNAKNLKVTQSDVVQQEILKHYNKVDQPEKSIQIQKRNYSFKNKRKKLRYYDDSLFEGSINRTSDDAGEKANLAACIDRFNPKMHETIVYLTDDKKAIDKEDFKLIFESFPYFLCWSSFEVILFLYRNDHKNFTYDYAVSSIQNIIHFLLNAKIHGWNIQKGNGQIDEDKFNSLRSAATQEYLQIKVAYIEKLDTISKIL